MKWTTGFWAAVFLISLFTAGFFPAVLITCMAVGASIATGVSVQDKLEGGPDRKSIGR